MIWFGQFSIIVQHVLEVAKLFQEQLKYYPRPRLNFAIIDDHNAGLDHNRDGNFAPFERALDQFDQADGLSWEPQGDPCKLEGRTQRLIASHV